MLRPIAGRITVAPDVGGREIAEGGLALVRHDQRQVANRRGAVSGRVHELGVLLLRDRMDRDLERVEFDPVRRPFVLVAFRVAHGELTTGDAGETGHQLVRHQGCGEHQSTGRSTGGRAAVHPAKVYCPA